MHGFDVVIDNPRKRCYVGISYYDNWEYSIDERGILTVEVSGYEEDGKWLERTLITNNWTIRIIPNPKGG